VSHGSNDCFDGVTFLHLGWPPGTATRFTVGRDVRQYVRDPRRVFSADALTARFSSDAVLPEAARSTGFHTGEWRLWVAAGGRVAFLVGDRRVERWPWNRKGLGCV